MQFAHPVDLRDGKSPRTMLGGTALVVSAQRRHVRAAILLGSATSLNVANPPSALRTLLHEEHAPADD